jgi:hypothetical protein
MIGHFEYFLIFMGLKIYFRLHHKNVNEINAWLSHAVN